MSSVGFLIAGIMFLIFGLAIVIGISDDDYRAFSAVAFIIGVIGTVFICAYRG